MAMQQTVGPPHQQPSQLQNKTPLSQYTTRLSAESPGSDYKRLMSPLALLNTRDADENSLPSLFQHPPLPLFGVDADGL